MSPSIPRGRLIFLCFATLVVTDRLLVIVLACIQHSIGMKLLWAVAGPGLVIYLTVLLWNGEQWVRWLAVSWCLFRGAISLGVMGFILYQMASITPPEQANQFLEFVAVIFGLPLLHGIFYVSAGLLLIFSPSLKAFFLHQAARAE